MPRIVDYEQVLEQMSAQRMKCLYHNSGSFGFHDGAAVQICGWIGPEDASIRHEALAQARPAPPPYEENLARLFERAWTELLPGPLWIMPASHWAYELEFGNADWMPAALREIKIDSADLQFRNNGAAIEFEMNESANASQFVERLLEHLAGSDFTLAFPGKPVICTLHHHKQLWWQAIDPTLINELRRLL
ncbi:MAG: hypothetical protein H7Z14_03055 [Anaerolineae bacterium]|nr:hypothetical protein [Phycisphaerae bacterium]